jgi:SNF2 family DNA or RNA helicase
VLSALQRNGRVLLADDMGLGKTVQVSLLVYLLTTCYSVSKLLTDMTLTSVMLSA